MPTQSLILDDFKTFILYFLVKIFKECKKSNSLVFLVIICLDLIKWDKRSFKINVLQQKKPQSGNLFF